MNMKVRGRTDILLILCGLLVWFLADARQLRLEAAKALTLCAGTVIPALFPFIVVTGLLVRLGFGQWLAPDMAGLMASLFRLPGCAGSALLLGLVGGYPIGARTAAELYASGDLTRQEAERLLTFCNNSNPVFLISVLGVGVFGSVRAGLWLWLIHVCAALRGVLVHGADNVGNGIHDGGHLARRQSVARVACCGTLRQHVHRQAARRDLCVLHRAEINGTAGGNPGGH